jgi:hypothetical protein
MKRLQSNVAFETLDADVFAIFSTGTFAKEELISAVKIDPTLMSNGPLIEVKFETLKAYKCK